jgi:hypothetical protein
MLKNSFGNQTSEITASNVEILLSKADVLIKEPQINSIRTTFLITFMGMENCLGREEY